MDIKYLTYILTIARKKNMTKAAGELFVSQSSLSQYISKLEQELGVLLFIRSKGELTLTPAGKLYIDAAEQVIHIRDELYHNIQGLSNKSHITIGVTSQFGLNLLTEVIPLYKKDYPEVTIEFSESNVPSLTKLLMEENIDCAIMALNTPEPFSPAQISMLKEEEIYLAVPAGRLNPELPEPGPLGESELIRLFSQEPFILSKKGSTLRNIADNLFDQLNFCPATICETNSVLASRAMVAAGTGVTFLGKTCASCNEHVAYYSIDPPQHRYNALICRKNWIMNDPETHLLNLMKDWFDRPAHS